jgi:hypothetical protein
MLGKRTLIAFITSFILIRRHYICVRRNVLTIHTAKRLLKPFARRAGAESQWDQPSPSRT